MRDRDGSTDAMQQAIYAAIFGSCSLYVEELKEQNFQEVRDLVQILCMQDPK